MSWRWAYALLCLLVTAGCVMPPPILSPPVPDYWPTQGWRTSTPEAQGMDSRLLAQAVGLIREQDLAVDSLLIVRHGYVVLDAYFYPYTADRLHDVASVTKSITSTLTGIAIEERLIRDLNASLAEFFPEVTSSSSDPRKAGIMIRHLVSMSSGLRCGYEPGEVELRAMLETPKWAQSVLLARRLIEADVRMVFVNWPTLNKLILMPNKPALSPIPLSKQYSVSCYNRINHFRV